MIRRHTGGRSFDASMGCRCYLPLIRLSLIDKLHLPRPSFARFTGGYQQRLCAIGRAAAPANTSLHASSALSAAKCRHYLRSLSCFSRSRRRCLTLYGRGCRRAMPPLATSRRSLRPQAQARYASGFQRSFIQARRRMGFAIARFLSRRHFAIAASLLSLLARVSTFSLFRFSTWLDYHRRCST